MSTLQEPCGYVLQPGAMSWALLVIAGSWVGGCSFLNLDEGFEAETCADQPQDFCEELNTLRPTGDDCSAWSCAPDGFCRVLPLDQDHDGSPAEQCVGADESFDCDDMNPLRSPLADEDCDGIDNDCDEMVDEDVFAVSSAVQVAPAFDEPVAVAYASDVAADPAALSYVADSKLGGALFDAIDSVASSEGQVLLSGASVAVRELGGTALTTLGLDRYAVLSVPTAGAGGVVLGVMEAGPAVASDFLSNEFADGACPDVASPAIAAAGADVLAAYVCRQPQPEHSCGNAPAADVVLVTAAVAENDAVSIDGGNRSVLGSTDDPLAPAIVAVDDFGWLVAFAVAGSGARVVEIYQASLDASRNLVVSGTPLLSEATETDAPGDVSLALGARSGEAGSQVQQVALGYRRGCGNRARVAARVLELDLAAGTLTAVGAAVSSPPPTAVEQRRPTLAWQSQGTQGWLLGFEEARQQLIGQRFDSSAAAIGARIVMLDDDSITGTGSAQLRLGMHLRSSTIELTFELLAYTPTDTAFQSQSLGCLSE